MTSIIHLVDDVNYSETNCYQHQLTTSLRQVEPHIKTLSLPMILRHQCDAQHVVCCLKQRTINKYASELMRYLGNTPWVIYDQDPWEALKDESPLKGTYDKFKSSNLKAIAVTTEHFANVIRNKNLPGEFVKMGMLPKYCEQGPRFESRKHQVAFIGTLHPRRKRLFDELQRLRVTVVTQPNNMGYRAYLEALHDVGIFIHNEDTPIIIDGKHDNMGKGMWIKDVEASARGCYSVRNAELGFETYCNEIPTIKVFKDPVDAAKIIKTIIEMDVDTRFSEIEKSVNVIKQQNDWQSTAHRLIELSKR